MKLLIDAQLPLRLAIQLREAGFEVTHTLDLPDGNRTTDQALIDISVSEQAIVVTKDSDFVNSFHLSGAPEKLLLISTGNISNADLEALFLPNLPAIVTEFQSHDLIELTRTALIIHV